MGELNKSFKPETMRLLVKLDEDGKYHEVGGLNDFSIEKEYNWLNNSDATLTIRGFNTHVGEDSFDIRKSVISDTPKTYTVKVGAETFVDELDALLDKVHSECSKMMPSKRHSYKGHLPERVIVSGPCVISFWHDGTKTISRCHDGDEMDVRTGILLNAIKKWMPGGTYWQGVMDDVTVEYQGKKEKFEPNFKIPHDRIIGHCKIVHEPVNHDKPCRPYMRGGRYGDDEKMHVIELVESGMTQTEASRATGISQSTISTWMSQWRGND